MDEPVGGLGGLQTNVADGATHRASDLHMIARAVREQWPIPMDKRPSVVERLIRNATDQSVDPGVSVRAAGVLVAMTALNQKDDHHVEDIAAGKHTPATGDIRILVVNDAGAERAVGSIGEFYRSTAKASPPVDLPDGHAVRPEPLQGRNGRATGGQNGLAHGGGGQNGH